MQAQQSCESLASIKIPNLTITSAKALPAGWELPTQEGFINTKAGQKVSVPFCRIEAYSAPTKDSHIGIEVWLPLAANWNGKFFGVGNPGFIGSLARGALAGNVAARMGNRIDRYRTRGRYRQMGNRPSGKMGGLGLSGCS